MQRKKKSFKDIFFELENFGVKELYDTFINRLKNKKANVSDFANEFETQLETLNTLNSFVIISNLATISWEYVSSNCKNIIGYEKSELQGSGGHFLSDSFCYADKISSFDYFKKIINHQQKTNALEKSNINYLSTFRIYHKKGYYMWILSQLSFIKHDEKGKPTLSISFITDIEDFKADDYTSLVIWKQHPETGAYHIEEHYSSPPAGIEILSKNELTILKLLSDGLNNMQIADLLGFSEHQIKDYRKKMLKKTWCSNITELIYYAYRNNLIKL